MEISFNLLILLVVSYCIFVAVLPFIIRGLSRRMNAIEDRMRDLEQALFQLEQAQSQPDKTVAPARAAPEPEAPPKPAPTPREETPATAPTTPLVQPAAKIPAPTREAPEPEPPPRLATVPKEEAPATVPTTPLVQPAANAGARTDTSIEKIPAPSPALKDTAAGEPPAAQWEVPPTPDMFLDRLRIWLLGGNTLARIGVIILFLGVAFLLKFAIDQGWLAIELRLAGAALGGFLLVAIGWRLRNRRPSYALIVQGGGIGIIYLTVFAAVNFYQLISALPGLGLMLSVVVLASTLAVLQDARGLTLLAMTGGFLAPVLISSNGSHVMLFSYYAVLNVGILGIAWFKAWRELNLIGFIFTFVISTGWGMEFYQPDYFATTEPFLILFFLFYVAIPVLFALHQPPNLRGYVDGSLIFGVPLVAAGLQQALVRDMEYGLALSALAAGLFYAMLATALWKTRHANMRLLTEAFLTLAILFGTLAIPFALEGRWTGATWALEGAALVWLGVRQRRLLARCSGLLLQFGGGLFLLNEMTQSKADLPVLNSLYLCALLISLSGLLCGYYYYRHRQILREEEQPVAALALAWALGWWFGAGLQEIHQFVDRAYQPNAILGFMTASLTVIGVLRRPLAWPYLSLPPRVLFFAMLASTVSLLTHLDTAHPMADGGWLVWPVAFVCQYWLLRRFQPEWSNEFVKFWHLGTFLLLVFLVTWEAGWLVKQATLPPIWVYITWALVPATVVVMAPMLESKLAWPVRQFSFAYQEVGLCVLAMLLGIWVLHASLQPGDPDPLPYVPLFNPLELTQSLVLVSLTWWHWRSRSDLVARIPWYSWPVLAFAALNGAIARAVHLLGHIPLEFDALWVSPVYQSVVSITWTLVALGIMVPATRLQRRPPWMLGATLLGAVVIKLFVIDLAGIGTLARIISFIVVGLLILLIGYLSPLPPRSQRNHPS